MTGPKAPFAILAALAAATLAHAGETVQPFEQVKRDLRSLPATESKIPTGNKTPGEKSALPGGILVPQPGGQVETSAEAATKAARSANWLVDGLAHLEKEDRARQLHDAGERAAARKEGSAAFTTSGFGALGERPASSSDPLGAYLAQLFSPRDLALLKQASPRSPGWDKISGGSMSDVGAVSRSMAIPGSAAGAQTPSVLVESVRIDDRRVNPYLQNPVESPAVFPVPAPVAAEPVSVGSTFRPFQQLPQSAGEGAVGPSTVQPGTTPSSAEVPSSSTSRIVDDRKYFPQLRRF